MLKNRFKKEYEEIIDEEILDSIFDFFSPFIKKEKIDSIKVFEMKESGMGVTDIARFFGVSRRTIYNKINKHRGPVSIKRKKIDAIRVMEMKESGMGVTDIARFFGVSRRAIYNILDKHKKTATQTDDGFTQPKPEPYIRRVF